MFSGSHYLKSAVYLLCSRFTLRVLIVLLSVFVLLTIFDLIIEVTFRKNPSVILHLLNYTTPY